MKALYTQTPMICKLNEIFSKIFSKETKPTQQHIIDLLMSVLGLNGFRSVKFCYSHFIQSLSDFKLKSYYFMLNESKIYIDTWMEALILMAISIIPKELVNNCSYCQSMIQWSKNLNAEKNYLSMQHIMVLYI